MHGSQQRHIRQRGVEYEVYNASGGGGRDTPDYNLSGTPDDTVVAVLERRGQAQTVTLSSGEEVDTRLQLRAVLDGQTIREAGQANYPSKLVHPDGLTYDVLVKHPEDSGVTVLTIHRA